MAPPAAEPRGGGGGTGDERSPLVARSPSSSTLTPSEDPTSEASPAPGGLARSSGGPLRRLCGGGAAALLALGAHALLAGSPEAFAFNPLHRRALATPLAWLFGLAAVLAAPSSAAALRATACAGGPGKRSGAPPDLHEGVLAALGVACSAAAMALLVATPAGACVGGWPKTPAAAAAAGCFCDREVALGSPRSREEVPPDLTLAFVGESGLALGDDVLRLLRDEGASAVIFNGDTSYIEENEQWVQKFEEHLGRTPFYVAAHEPSRSFHEPEPHGCRGEAAAGSACLHRGVGLLLRSLSGSCGGRDALFERALSEFAAQDASWPICVFSFHDNRGGQGADPWENYDLCLQRGALIISSHAEPFARTHELDALFQGGEPRARVSREVAPGSGSAAAARLRDGHSVVVMTGPARGAAAPQPGGGAVAGASGWGPAMVEMLGPEAAAEEQASEEANRAPGGPAGGASEAAPQHDSGSPGQGAFFCRFHVEGDPRLARCFFKDTAGRVADEFYLRRPGGTGGSLEFV